MTLPTPDHLTTASHWGVFRAAVDDGRITLTPAAGDFFPSPNVHAIEAQPYMKSRVLHPMVRKSFLEKKPGNAANRGRDEWVQVDWGALRRRERVRHVKTHSSAWHGCLFYRVSLRPDDFQPRAGSLRGAWGNKTSGRSQTGGRYLADARRCRADPVLIKGESI